jgi:hypothetical protein
MRSILRPSSIATRCLRKLSYAILLAGLLFFSTPFCKADVDHESTAKAQVIFAEMFNKWSSIQTIRYDLEVKDVASDGFQKFVNEKDHNRDVLLTKVSFEIKGEDYGWKTDTIVPATGAHDRVSKGGLDKGTLLMLFEDQKSLLVTSTDPKWLDFVPITGNNPVFEAFSFLISDSWKNFNCPTLTLATLLSPQTWINAAKRVKDVSQGQFKSQPCIRIVFGDEKGEHDVIYFPNEVTGFPMGWQHYQGGFLVREVSIGNWTPLVLPDGKTISFPSTLTRQDFFDPSNPEVFCTSYQTLKNVTINGTISDDDFVLDPSQADAIYDRDHDKRITIPK